MNESSPAPRPSYAKPWLSYAHQLQRLVDRGLHVVDALEAERFLSHINYYRFSGYCLAFEQQRHAFSGGVTFEQVREAYQFDLTLRDLVTEALEIVEVDFRAAIAFHWGRERGAFGHVQANCFHRTFPHADWLTRAHEETDRSRELFVEHFRNCYAEYPNLPIWMLTEILSFGGLSKMYSGMQSNDHRAIASRYGIQPKVMQSWLHHLVYVRNLCAHHARLWDRSWAIKPSLPAGLSWQKPLIPTAKRLFSTLLILYYLLKQCPGIGDFAAQWRQRIHHLLAAPPAVVNPYWVMGMPNAWQTHPVWK